jgi:ubiquinone/menaquinone biosynthesis C-methylase UbiE
LRNTAIYYESISKGYDELYGEEQLGKADIIKFADGRVLDVGCGTSILTKLIRGKFVVGLDLSESMIKKGRTPDIIYVIGTAEALPFKNRSFDSVVSTTMLQDVANPKAALSEMVRVGRKTLVSVPSRSKLDLMGLARAAKTELKEHFTAGKDRFYVI